MWNVNDAAAAADQIFISKSLDKTNVYGEFYDEVKEYIVKHKTRKVCNSS